MVISGIDAEQVVKVLSPSDLTVEAVESRPLSRGSVVADDLLVRVSQEKCN